MHSVHRLAAVLGSLGAAGAMVLTMAGAAGAAIGPPVGSAGQSGYQIDGGQFRFAHGVYQGHTLVAHQNDPAVHDSTTINGVTTPGDSLNTPDQQELAFGVFYDRIHGDIEFEFVATASGDSYQGFYHAGTGLSFSRVRFGTDFGNTPFDSVGYIAAPSVQKNYLTWRSAGLTSYSGHRGDLIDWWTRHRLVLVDAAGGSHPTSLFNGGTAFRTVLTP
jgi:hypothetical protein